MRYQYIKMGKYMKKGKRIAVIILGVLVFFGSLSGEFPGMSGNVLKI